MTNFCYSCIIREIRKGSFMNKLYKICFYISIFIIVLGVVMTAMSLAIVIPSGITADSAIVPGAFLLLTVVGIIFTFYYKKKLKEGN